MVIATPDWLQNAIDFLNKEFPNDEEVYVCLLYGCGAMPSKDGKDIADAKYLPYNGIIYLVDYEGLIEIHGYNGENAPEDITIVNLFHEYGHHRQYISGRDFDEDDAENFAMDMWRKYLVYEEQIKSKSKE